MVALDGLHEMGDEPGERYADENASAGAEDEQFAEVREGGRGAACCFKEGKEEDGGDAVVEEGFAGKLGLQIFWRVDAAEHFEDGDGIGGGNERAENKTLENGYCDAGERGDPPGEGGYAGGGEDGAEDRSEERRVGKSVDLGGRRIIKKKKTQ